MKVKYDVTIAVLTYNPNYEKLMLTLNSILNQKNINYEILISDDGSQVPLNKEIINFFKTNNFQNYRIVSYNENCGTVYNCINVAKNAYGKYLFLTSPGDMLYDDYAISKVFNFAEKKKSKICFGNAIYYNYIDNNVNIVNTTLKPKHLSLYKNEKLYFLTKLDFFLNDGILGASYFRKTEIALLYFEKIYNFNSKYVEDTTSSLCALLDNIKIDYFDCNLLWYEYGLGVSTGSNSKWKKILENDYNNVLINLKKNNPKNSLVNIAYQRMLKKNKLNILKRIIKYPILSFEQFLIKLSKVYTQDDLKYDVEILKNKIEKRS